VSEAWIVRGWWLLIVASAALAWELAARLHWADPELLPPLSLVLATLWQLLGDPAFRSDVEVTLMECAVAFLIVAPVGLICGFILGETPRLERLFAPTLQLLMTIPKSIFLPVFILLFGIDFPEKVIFAVALAYFIVVPSGLAAAKSVPRGLIMVAHAAGATRAQVYGHVYLPAVTPLILGGARLALIFTIHGIIFAEMYASSQGIGRRVLDWGESFQMRPMLATVLLILLVTVLLNESMQLIEARARSRLSLRAQT
jgi:ABC-type nitrate/sulfonate/bicarbonate transport system permease component